MTTYNYNKDGTVQCIVCVELTFTPDPEALEEAQSYEGLSRKEAIISLFDDGDDVVHMVEDELVSLANDVGEFDVGGIWLTDKYYK